SSTTALLCSPRSSCDIGSSLAHPTVVATTNGGSSGASSAPVSGSKAGPIIGVASKSSSSHSDSSKKGSAGGSVPVSSTAPVPLGSPVTPASAPSPLDDDPCSGSPSIG